MRRFIVLLKTFGLVCAILTPAVLAVLNLGLGLAGVDRMHHRVADRPSVPFESVGEYVDQAGEEGLRFRTVTVRRD